MYVRPRCARGRDDSRDAIEIDGPLVVGTYDPHDGPRLLVSTEVERDSSSLAISLNLRGLTREQVAIIVHAAVECGALTRRDVEKAWPHAARSAW